MSSSSEDSDSVAEPTQIKKRKYSQLYKKEWEEIGEFKSWLKESSKGKAYAMCTACHKDINVNSGKDALLKHRISKAHQNKIKIITNQPSVSKFTVDLSAKRKIEDSIKEGNIIIYM